MKKSAIGLLLFACLSLNLFSQSPFQCGNVDLPEIKRQLLQNREEMRDFVRERNAVTYVPVRFWLVAKSNGDDRPSERNALQALCYLNENYKEQDIQYYLKEFKYINNTTIYNNPQSSSGTNSIANLMSGNYNALNVFIVDDAGDGAAAYYQPPAGPGGQRDYIVCGSTYAPDIRVLSHEVGHFFSLPHPFYGWEISGGWDPALHGNPVGFWAPDGQTLNELVNGSNCSNAGDGICDTPADYMFPSNQCEYTLNAKDPNNALLQPDESNYMNYFFNCPSYFFTDEQKDAISSSLFHATRNYVRPNLTPNLAAVNNIPTLVSPASNELVTTYNNVKFQWSAVTGADRYLVEVTKANTEPVRLIVNTTEVTVTTLLPNSNYFWKVMAFNEYSTCTGFTTQRILKTGDVASDTSESPLVNNWSVRPNPVTTTQELLVNVESAAGLETSVLLYDMGGKLLKTVKHLFPAGYSTLEMPMEGTAAGVYLVVLQIEKDKLVQKVVVLE
jgi:hypothetical protein